MQFVWVYWHGGARNDELRWSMRSVRKNYQGNVKIMLVGDKPDWYNGPHIAVKRLPRGASRAFRDSLNKLMTAVADDSVDEEFIWMMDDIYMVQPVTEAQIKTHYYQSEFTPRKIENRKQGNKWQRLKNATMRVLMENGLPLRDYATHLPQHVEKAKFKELVCRFNPCNTQSTLLWEILYGNTFATEYKPSKHVLYRTLKKKDYHAFKNQKRLFVNNGNHAWCEGLRGYLYETFSDSLPFETLQAPKPRAWYRSGLPETKNTLPIPKEKIVAIVPYRPSADRKPAWGWVRAYLENQCNEIVLADCKSEKFNRSQAINNAFRKIAGMYPDDTIIVIADADCVVTTARCQDSCREAMASSKLVIPHDSVCRMTPEQSAEILGKYSPVAGPRGTWFRNNRIHPSVSGLITIRKDMFERVNGFDEQFVDWGGEDNAFKIACDKLLGESIRLGGPLFHFWHTPSPMVDKVVENKVRHLAYRGASSEEIQTLLCTQGLQQVTTV